MKSPLSIGLASWAVVAFSLSCQSHSEPKFAQSKAVHLKEPAATQPAFAFGGSEIEGERGVEVLENEVTENGYVTFRSFGGKWVGMDGDTELKFLPGRTVQMTEFGYSVAAYLGTYTVSQGCIIPTFPTYPGHWPIMKIGRDNGSLWLTVPDEQSGIPMGGRGGFTVTPEQPAYWPFRSISK